MASVKRDEVCVTGNKPCDPAGFAVKERLFDEIDMLRDAVFSLKAKLAPISVEIPTGCEATSPCGPAQSEYFSSIFQAAVLLSEIQGEINRIYEEVEL